MKVAAYCRVSTDKSDQVNSLESQKIYFENYIKTRGNWEFVRIYADEGISGTQVKRRPEFLAMIDDATNKKIDLILTKEISRFARNTVDSLQYTRQLKDLGVGVVFIGDNINTLDPDAELRLAIMSSIAQEEVRKLSDRVKWGQKRKMEQGAVFGHRILGYDIINGKLVVNAEEAKIVKLIFHKYVTEGKGIKAIASELNEQGVTSRSKTTLWLYAGVRYILHNEKYVGDLLQKKNVTLDYLSHKKVINRNHEEQVFIPNNHEAIIDRDTWNATQEELARRNTMKEGDSRYSNRHWFSGKIKCGECGTSFILRERKMQHGTYKSLICRNVREKGKAKVDNKGDSVGCNSGGGVPYKALTACINFALNRVFERKELIISILQKDFAKTANSSSDMSLEDLKSSKARIEEKKQRVIELYANQDISISELRKMKEKYAAESEAVDRKFYNQQNSQFIFDSEMDKLKQVLLEIESSNLLDEKSAGEFYKTSIEYVTVSKNHIGVKIKNVPIVIDTYYESNGKQGKNFDVIVSQKDGS